MMRKRLEPRDSEPILRSIAKMLHGLNYSPDTLAEVARLLLITHGLCTARANPKEDCAPLLHAYYDAIVAETIGLVETFEREQRARPEAGL